MADTLVDATIAKAMDQALFDQAQIFRAQQTRATAGDAAVAELTRNVFLQGEQLIGAHAAQTLETDRLSQQILAQRSARDQPASTPFAAPVKAA
jgi:hypothetical protein